MAKTTRTLFRHSDGVLAAVRQDGQRQVIENDGSGNIYYTLGVGGRRFPINVDMTVATATLSVTPTEQSHLYSGIVATFVEQSGVDGDSVTVTSADGTIANVDFFAKNQVKFDYTTPAQDFDEIFIEGTDFAGNAFHISFVLVALTA